MQGDDLARWLREEHEKVDEHLRSLHVRVGCIPRTNEANWIADARETFEHFRGHFVKHMALEEQDGYMASVISQRPTFQPRVAKLAREHEQFTKLMSNIYSILMQLEPGDHLMIRDCCRRTQDLIAYIHHHEDEENMLVTTAFVEDIGTKD